MTAGRQATEKKNDKFSFFASLSLKKRGENNVTPPICTHNGHSRNVSERNS